VGCESEHRSSYLDAAYRDFLFEFSKASRKEKGKYVCKTLIEDSLATVDSSIDAKPDFSGRLLHEIWGGSPELRPPAPQLGRLVAMACRGKLS